MKTQILTYLLGAWAFISAVTGEKCSRPPDEGVSCTYFAFARDYSGLDGCGMLLALPDGTKLLATNLDSLSASIKHGDALKIEYTRLRDVVSICMTEKSVVRLTCLSLLSLPGTGTEMVDPYRVAWAERVMQDVNPRTVEALDIDSLRAYRFTSSKEIRIYAWDGSLICSYTARDQSPCSEVLAQLRDSRVIYTVNEDGK